MEHPESPVATRVAPSQEHKKNSRSGPVERGGESSGKQPQCASPPTGTVAVKTTMSTDV